MHREGQPVVAKLGAVLLVATGTISARTARDAVEIDVLVVIAASFGLGAATVVRTEFISNNAATALMFAIAMATASQAGANPRAFAITVAIAASSSFLTPIGYQTNTMVYGPGGSRLRDYLRLGAPLTIASVLTVVFSA